MVKMRKRKYLICISIVLGIMIGSIITEKIQRTEKVKPFGSGSMIAMYIQDEEGNYQLSEDQNFPTDGYVLNTEKTSCKNGGVISQNPETKKLSLKVKTSDECTVYFEKERFITLANGLKANLPSVTNYENGTKTEMYVFDHPEATQTTGWTAEERRDYRYIGANPNNYITFNDEMWRIIGVFTVETESGNKEQLIKIIRDKSINSLQWDKGYIDENYETVWSNEWSTSSLYSELNENYYNQSGDYTSSASIRGLNSTARSQVAKVKWYLGSLSTEENLGGPDYYAFERGITTCANGCIYYCCTGETRTTSIVQNVGLMYVSDYVFTYANGVNDTCYSNGFNCVYDKGGDPNSGWLFKGLYNFWTQNTSTRYVLSIYSVGIVAGADGNSWESIQPTLYLNSSVKIVSGDGSSESPYVIE